MMVNVRGSHGSGKTTISRRFLEEHDHEERVEPANLSGIIRAGSHMGEPYSKNFKKPNAFVIEGGLVMVGRKQAGMDGYLPHDTIEDSIRYWAERQPFLLFENVLLSANIGRWGVLFNELEPVNHAVLAHLDTGWELSKRRVLQRRAEAREAGFKHRQADEDLNTGGHFAHWKRCRRTATRAALQGFDVRWLDHNFAYELVHDMLVRAGWPCAKHGLFFPDFELGPWVPSTEEAEEIIKTCQLPWLPVEDIPQPRRGAKKRDKVTPPAVAAVGTINQDYDPLAEMGDPFEL